MAGKKAQAKSGSKGKKSSTKKSDSTERLVERAQEEGLVTPEGALIPRGAAIGSNTATGQALHESERERPENEGSPLGEPEGAFNIFEDHENSDEQTAPARYAVNGQVENGMVPSNYGPVPVAAVARDADHAKELLDQHNENLRKQILRPRTKLTEAQISRASKQELRAIGISRGYDIPEAGSRVTREAFLRAQDEDENTVEAEKE